MFSEIFASRKLIYKLACRKKSNSSWQDSKFQIISLFCPLQLAITRYYPILPHDNLALRIKYTNVTDKRKGEEEEKKNVLSFSFSLIKKPIHSVTGSVRFPEFPVCGPVSVRSFILLKRQKLSCFIKSDGWD